MFYTHLSGSESDGDTSSNFGTPLKCNRPHNGRLLLDDIFSVHIDQLFTMLFTNSKFFVDLQEFRRASGVTATEWSDDINRTKKRVITMTIPLNQPIGPKSCHVTETQYMQPCSEPGSLYSIDVKIENRKIPYADRFYLTVHFCIVKCSDQETSMEVYGDVIYTQKPWGIIKTILEKSTWSGLTEVYSSLREELHNAIEENGNTSHTKKRHKKKRRSSSNRLTEKVHSSDVGEKIQRFQMGASLVVLAGLLFILILVNIYLFYILSSLEGSFSKDFVRSTDIRDRMTTTHENFIDSLQQNQVMPNNQIDKWLNVITDTLLHLRNAEESLKHKSYKMT